MHAYIPQEAFKSSYCTRRISSLIHCPQWPKRLKTQKKFTGSKIGAIFWQITSRVTTKNLKIGQRGNFEKFAFWCLSPIFTQFWPFSARFLVFGCHFLTFLAICGSPKVYQGGGWVGGGVSFVFFGPFWGIFVNFGLFFSFWGIFSFSGGQGG